ncbi:hypothetical protein K488DRAFT_72525 [Vararia minispora EC-137]|uniref:Uncharacterized protein n=1 Tax=Vararia minispora EC-137 TaxID=1314806 RepID=A0ACB8QDY1_9AGAM|nr:hypothetical protein K488DRAFT_72525 [Vararia minispora EC-137]
MRLSDVLAVRSCCLFIPLRLGAAILATLQFILSAILAVALWVEVTKWNIDVGSRLSGSQATAATYYTILSLSALLGSLAIFARSKNILRYFAFCLGWSLGIQLAVSALQLWGYLSTPRTMAIAACSQLPGMNEERCMREFSLSVGWLFTSIVVGLLVQLCSAYIVSSYSTKLSGEDAFTEQVPAPDVQSIAPSQPANFAAPSDHMSRSTFSSSFINPDGSENEKNEKERDPLSTNSYVGMDEKDELRFDPGPPKVPMLAPAPAKRIPRVRPQYPVGMSPGSTNSAILTAVEVKAPTNPFADRAVSSQIIPNMPGSNATNADPFTDAAGMV